MRRTVTIMVMLLLAGTFAQAANDIRIDKDYDPRIELRAVVTPAMMPRTLNRTDPRTVSALFATELLRQYEVVDLDRFEQFLIDRRFDLTTAFTLRAESVVRDSAQIDAIADIEIYLWDTGSGGIPLLGRQSGKVGMRIRLMDPYTGRVYWSINRVEGVSPNADFLKRATVFFKDVVTDLGHKLDDVREGRDEIELAAGMNGSSDMDHPPALPMGKFTVHTRKDRGFVPVDDLAGRDLAARTDSERIPVSRELKTEEGTLLPPLFEDSYEDIEQADEINRAQGPVENLDNTNKAGPPPLPASLRLDNLPTETPKAGGQ